MLKSSEALIGGVQKSQKLKADLQVISKGVMSGKVAFA